MGTVDDVARRKPAPKVEDKSKESENASHRSKKPSSEPGFLGRRIQLGATTSTTMGIVLMFPVLVIVLIMVIFARSPGSDSVMEMPSDTATSIRKISEKYDKPFAVGCLEPRVNAPRAKAAFVVLARNKELDGVLQSVKSIERHFNRWFHYPYVFLNDGDFNDTFKETVEKYTSAKVEWGKIDPGMWGFPDWVDPAVAKEGIAQQGDAGIMYGGMESYHHMCRFYSGFFYKHELLQKYEWYWRLEPDIKYFCDITYDPFLHMIRNNKTYGFTIAVKELRETVPNIFRYASAFMRKNKIKSQGLWEMFVEKPEEREEREAKEQEQLEIELKSKKSKSSSKKTLDYEHAFDALPKIDAETMEGESYNMCHFWSNFEIARLDFFRSKEYNDFFEMMDRSGGFWMERWGDAPIHSLAAGALLGPRDIHYFRDFGYRHTTIQHCPANAPGRQLTRMPYLEKTTLDEKKRREEDEYWAHPDPERENGVGCRCKCDTDIVDVEGKQGSCLAQWVEVAGGWVTPAST